MLDINKQQGESLAMKNLLQQIQQIKDKLTGNNKSDKCSQYSIDGVIHISQDGKDYILSDLPAGLVVKGDLYLNNKGLTELPDLSKVTVEGDFLCEGNELTSLKGAPQKVGGSFRGRDNELTSLTGAPQEIGGDFWCYDNQLTSLIGAPQKVGKSFVCYNNKLTTLQGAPQEVGGSFGCENNQLTSLTGAPQKVGGDFRCENNQLTSLTGAPQEVGGDFNCETNLLTTLNGAPQKVDGDFSCYGNDNLLSLHGLPEMSEDREIYCNDELMVKYGCSSTEAGSICYSDLMVAPVYQNELRISELRQKKHEENKANQNKFKAGYAAFKKKQNEDRE
jgi:hypothetical protein